MKKTLLIIICSFLFVSPCIAGQYRVLKVIDGDTIDIQYKGKKERIRMLCVDTPESVHPDRSRNTPLGKKASEYTRTRLAGRSVDIELETKTRGKYGRLLAYVILDGENFNIVLVREGWSKYYTKYGKSENHHETFQAAEAQAQAKGLRVWADNPQENGSEFTATEYHGNIKSRKFHSPNCRYYNCKSCTIIFKSKKEAERAGYSPCGLCRL